MMRAADAVSQLPTWLMLILLLFFLGCRQSSSSPESMIGEAGVFVLDQFVAPPDRQLSETDMASVLENPRSNDAQVRERDQYKDITEDLGLLDAASASDAVTSDALSTSDIATPDAELSTSLRYDEVVFAATHNSYSGGLRGTILAQLDLGIRCLEFDFHDNDYLARQHYRVGHSSPEGEVAFGGDNPEGSALRDWLQVVVSWSDANPGHAPITVLLDAKDDLRDNPSPKHGNLGRLNDMLRGVVGDKLYAAVEFRRWPELTELTDKIVVVLSGDQTTRKAYLVDEGHDPAVAVSAGDRVVSMHSDGGDRLWYWTGQLTDRGVTWLHHGRYDTGRQPSLLFLDETWLVEVHRSHTRDKLFGAVGRYTHNGEIAWYEERELFDGRRSSLTQDDEGRIRLVFENNQGGISVAYGSRSGGEISFDAPEVTQLPLGDVAMDRGVVVSTSTRIAETSRALVYRTPRQRIFYPIRYEQLMFSEFQSGDGEFLRQSASFAGFSSGSTQQVIENRDDMVTRLWSFDQADAEFVPPHLPATDEPFSRWFDRTMRDHDAVDWTGTP